MESLPLSPGNALASAREQAGLTIAQVASALNLQPRVIVALEEERFSELHGLAFVSGCLRNYSELLGLDSDLLVNCYREMAGNPQPVLRVADNQQTPLTTSAHRQTLRASLALAAACLIVAILAFTYPDTKLSERVSREEGISVDTAIGTTIIPSVEMLPEINPTQDMLPEPGATTHQDVLPQGTPPVLSFRFSADCWVEVFDGDNQRIVASMHRANDTLELTGKPPFRITLGYSPGVDLSYNNQPVKISTEDGHTAHIILGNS